MRIGFDAKRAVRNRTGLGSYGRTLINALAKINTTDELRLYAPDRGFTDIRQLIVSQDNVTFCHPKHVFSSLGKAYWRSHGIVKNLKNDHIDVFHGLSGE